MKFRPGDTIVSFKESATSVFEGLDAPLRISAVSEHCYYWKPRFGVVSGVGPVKRIDETYRLTLWSWLTRWLR